MKKAWSKVEFLIFENAVHKKKGIKMAELTQLDILKNAVTEVVELAAAPNDISEMVDILGCLIHYCVISGWSMEQIEEVLIKKLKERIG